MRINSPNSTSPTGFSGKTATRQVTPTASSGSSEISDNVTLSPAGISTLQDRSARIAELKAAVNAPGYEAPARPITQTLIARSLSRPSQDS